MLKALMDDLKEYADLPKENLKEQNLFKLNTNTITKETHDGYFIDGSPNGDEVIKNFTFNEVRIHSTEYIKKEFVCKRDVPCPQDETRLLILDEIESTSPAKKFEECQFNDCDYLINDNFSFKNCELNNGTLFPGGKIDSCVFDNSILKNINIEIEKIEDKFPVFNDNMFHSCNLSIKEITPEKFAEFRDYIVKTNVFNKSTITALNLSVDNIVNF